MTLNEMGANEWLIVAGAVMGPILAVQVQKWIERSTEAGRRKTGVFYTLMATRGERLAPVHITALNSIDLAFFGFRLFGWPVRSGAAQEVIDCWHEYHLHLSPAEDKRPSTPAAHSAWAATSNELFLNLLEALAKATNHRFDRKLLRDGGYYPTGASAKADDQDALLRSMLEVFRGDRAMPFQIHGNLEQENQWRTAIVALLARIEQNTANPPTPAFPAMTPVAADTASPVAAPAAQGTGQ